jgi:hypothetical protein
MAQKRAAEAKNFKENNMMEGQEDSSIGFVSTKRRKNFKNTGKGTRSFQYRFFIGCIIVESYFLYNFTNSRILLENMQDLMLEMNSTAISKAWYARTFNMLRWLIIDPDLPMSNKPSTEVIG